MVEGAAGSWSPGGPRRELSLRPLEDRHRHLHYLPAPDLRPPCTLLTGSSPDPGLAHRGPWARLTSLWARVQSHWHMAEPLWTQ